MYCPRFLLVDTARVVTNDTTSARSRYASNGDAYLVQFEQKLNSLPIHPNPNSRYLFFGQVPQDLETHTEIDTPPKFLPGELLYEVYTFEFRNAFEFRISALLKYQVPWHVNLGWEPYDACYPNPDERQAVEGTA
jgi:hypothetical protein